MQSWQWVKVHVVVSHSVLSYWTVQEKVQVHEAPWLLLSVLFCQGSLLSTWQIPQWTELLQMETVLLFKLHYLRYREPSRRGLLWLFCIGCKFLWFPGAILLCYFSLYSFGAKLIAGSGGISFTIFTSLSCNSNELRHSSNISSTLHVKLLFHVPLSVYCFSRNVSDQKVSH